jgi:hypothetical protein
MPDLSAKDPISVVVTCFVSGAVWAVANSIYLPFVADTQVRIPAMDAGNWLTYRFLTADPLSYSTSWLVFHRFLEIPAFRGVAPIAVANGMVFGTLGGWYGVAWSACRSLSHGGQIDFPRSAFRYIRWSVLFLLGAVAMAAMLSVHELWPTLELSTTSKFVVFTVASTGLSSALYLAIAFTVNSGIALHRRLHQKRF